MAYNHYNKNLKLIARKLRSQATRAEKIVWYELLSGKRFYGYKFLRQRTIADFVEQRLGKPREGEEQYQTEMAGEYAADI